MNLHALVVTVMTCLIFPPVTIRDDLFTFRPGAPDGLTATALRPESPDKIKTEIEYADDSISACQTRTNHAPLTSLIPRGTFAGRIDRFSGPHVRLSGGDFLWLSAPRPTTPPFTSNLPAWIRPGNLEPDRLRVGTDIGGSGVLKGAFRPGSETVVVPLPGTVMLMGPGLLLVARRREYP